MIRNKQFLFLASIATFILVGCIAKKPKTINSPLMGYKDIQWGESQKEVISKFKNVEDVIFKSKDSNSVYFTGGEYCGKMVTFYNFEFVGDKFYNLFISVIGGKSDYKEIKELIQTKWGLPSYSFDEESIVSATWQFSDSSYIWCSPAHDGTVSIMYVNNKLKKIADDNKKINDEKEKEKRLKSL
ncbi:MAG: hypothetical protein RDU76_08210 [Candidatus Edwardsbacteria bacterium]|nr:hypothetical protein [Candidatus Edwardsbacteria bacterium]